MPKAYKSTQKEAEKKKKSSADSDPCDNCEEFDGFPCVGFITILCSGKPSTYKCVSFLASEHWNKSILL